MVSNRIDVPAMSYRYDTQPMTHIVDIPGLTTKLDIEGVTMRLSSPADLGAVVRAARRKLGLSQQELAERSGMSRQSLVALEQGTANPTWDTVLRVSGVLGMNLSASLGAVPAESNHRPLPKRRPVRSARLADADREDDVVMAKQDTGVGDELMVVVEAQPSGTPLSTRSSDSKPVKPVNLDALLSDYDRA